MWRHAAYAMAPACVIRASAPRPLGPDQEAERRERKALARMTQKQLWAVGQTAAKPRTSSSTASQRHLTQTHSNDENAHQRIVSKRFLIVCFFLLIGVLGKGSILRLSSAGGLAFHWSRPWRHCKTWLWRQISSNVSLLLDWHTVQIYLFIDLMLIVTVSSLFVLISLVFFLLNHW